MTKFAVQKSPYTYQTPLSHTDFFNYETITHCNVSDRCSHYSHPAYIAASANYLQHPSYQLLCHCNRTRSQ